MIPSGAAHTEMILQANEASGYDGTKQRRLMSMDEPKQRRFNSLMNWE